MNFIYISPNFPANHWNFCHHLKENGMNVLGIGDAPYDSLTTELKGSLTEYYKVSSLENYEEVFRAVAFFTYKYGKIDWLESNNEYWLEKDALLRTEFNITTGLHTADMEPVKYKSRMKENYIKAGIPVARYHMVDDYEGCLAFIQEVGLPVVAKPDNGVGANDNHKFRSEEDLKRFFENKYDEPYIME
ncbi:MAG: carbamoylphosphate synthase large subunit, partial [Solobacterium sp.]|nr:carbamoylphosphate synthase large subunit [Solobacterium sp.]